jgi:hypothetical protein
MSVDLRAFDYLTPSPEERESMERLRTAAKNYAMAIITEVESGPDRTYILRQLRSLAMWANVAVTRNPDGTPRSPSTDKA